VAVPRPLDSLFDYSFAEDSVGPLKAGDMVSVPFGRTKLNACVVEVSSEKPKLDEKIKIKSISHRLDPEFSITPDVLKLCQFGANYYQYPIGEAFFVAMPPKPETILTARASKRVRTERKEKTLNEEQTAAVNAMNAALAGGGSQTFLLEGITGSGKTEVYIELAKRVLEQGKSVLILVPEIALTAQLRARFEQGLGETIALWHSALSDGVRQTQWRQVKAGELRVVVGARSAIFAPFKELGLIVVDEEHDQTYKQEERFRYQARDLALYRANLLGIPIVLGSATPSLETLHKVNEGKISHLHLKNRFSTRPLPELDFVSLIEEPLIFNEKVKSMIAERTIREIQATIDRGEQVLIFLNRRGFSQFILCKDCGWIKRCDHCSISMTHYQRRLELKCHVCGRTAKVPESCESCYSHELIGMGSGTESLEEELNLLLTGANVTRLDRDSVTSQKRLEETLADFRDLKSNILIGTQMLVKGHDFPKVTCVVVMLSDMLLKWPDFRASERALQTLIQVSGRSGRAELPGKVLIQGYDLEHPVLKILKGELDREEFIRDELELRKFLFYPPFSRMVRFRFEHEDAGLLKKRTEKITDELKTQVLPQLMPLNDKDKNAGFAEERIMGPSESLLFKAHNRYRYDLYLKSPTFELLFKFSRAVKILAAKAELDLIVDVDPYNS
jgi:primosomal protein N' (replication factor Y)